LPFEEVDAFRKKMIKAIREAEKNRDEVPSEDDELTTTKKNSVKRVEDLLKSRGIKAEELEPANRNYKEVISSAGNTSEEILDIEERIKDDIILKELKKRKNDDEEEFQQEEVIIDGVKYNYPTKGDDRRGVKSKKGFVQEIKLLKTVVNYFKGEQERNPSQENQSKLERAQERLEQLKSLNNNNNNNNNSQIPSLYLIGFIGLLIVVGIGFLIYKNNARKRRIY